MVDAAAAAARLGPEVACPFVGPRLGACSFEVHPWVDDDDRHELLCGVLKEGRDVLAHQPSGRRWPALQLARRRLDRCTGKYSFEDGDELLTHQDGAYASWVRDTFTAPLVAAGYVVHVSWLATSHNNLRLNFYETQDGFLHHALFRVTPDGLCHVGDDDAVDDVLSGFSADFWLYDVTVLREAANAAEYW